MQIVHYIDMVIVNCKDLQIKELVAREQQKDWKAFLKDMSSLQEYKSGINAKVYIEHFETIGIF